MPNISSGSETIGESFLLGTLLPIFILKDIFGIKKDKVMPMCLKENICKLKWMGLNSTDTHFIQKSLIENYIL